MDKTTALEYLEQPDNRTPSEVGEAVEVLYNDYNSYKKMANELRLRISPNILSSRHRIFRLPKGIRWKIDEGKILITIGNEISRLKNEQDQWLLAFAVVEEQLDTEVCANVVNRVLKYNDSIRDALSVAAGVKSDAVVPVLLPLGFDIRLALSQRAWNQEKEVADFCFNQIRQGIRVDLPALTDELREILSKLDSLKDIDM